MKISIGSHIIEGPWGGGNLFIINLSNYLIKEGHTVVYDLIDKDIDLILLTDPRGKTFFNLTIMKSNHVKMLIQTQL